MPLNFLMSVMSTSEFLLWAIVGYLFWKRDMRRRFPAMGTYLALRLGAMPVLLGALFIQSQPWGHGYFPVYFFTYWGVYMASAVVLFFICMEIFKYALSAFTGLTRFGTVVFRWAAIVSVISSLASVSYAHRGALLIPEIADGLMRSMSILSLCLLAFLCLSMNALHLSVRDSAVGIALGFGVMSANDFLQASWITRYTSLIAPQQFAYESMILVSLGVWVAYCALPEPARKPVVVAGNSTIYRWNEIASALGHPETQVAVQQPATSFFLTDVEKVVEKVLTRNLKESESNF